MSAAEHLNDVQFHQYKRTTYTIGVDPLAYRKVVAYKGDKLVGHLTWDSEADHNPEHVKNAISRVDVLKAHQGRGVASAMLEVAKRANPKIRHSHALTEDGKRFAERNPL